MPAYEQTKKVIVIKPELCYIIDMKGVTTHKVFGLPSVLKAYLDRQVQGKLIYFACPSYQYRQVVQSGNYHPKISDYGYI